MKRLFMGLVLACLSLPAAAAAEETARAPADSNVNHTSEAAQAPAGISGQNATESTSSYTLGDLGVKYNGSGISGSKAKGNEYGQMSDGPTASGVFEWADGPYTARFSGEFTGDGAAHNDGYQSKWYDFQGKFEKSDHYRLTGYANSIGHNISDGLTDKRSIYDSVYARQTGVRNEFTYNKVHSTAGVGGEASYGTPFFAAFNIDTRSVEGLLPLYNVNSANVPYELDYRVNTLSGQAGYRDSRLTMLVDAGMDSLDNNMEKELRANRNAAGALTGNTRMPVQESESWRVGGELALRLPEYRTTLTANGKFSHLSSDTIASSRSSGNTAATAWDQYEGDIDNTIFNATLVSSPFKGFTAKLYTRWFDRDNNSEITYNPNVVVTQQMLARDQMSLFEYSKQTFGGELAQRFGGGYKLSGGYEMMNTSRNAYGITKVRDTDDQRAWAQFNAPLGDVVDGHIRYQFLNRDSSDVVDTTDGVVTNPSSGVIAPWFSYLDTADKNQHLLEVGLDFSLTERLSMGAAYVYTLDDYARGDDILGMEKSEKHAGTLDMSYEVGPARLNAYGTVEYGNTRTKSRVFNGAANADPTLPDKAGSFNWHYDEKCITYSLGFNGTFDVIKDTLTFDVSYDYSQSDGHTRLDIPAVAGYQRETINPVDDYTQHTVDAGLTYSLGEGHGVRLGYSYARLNYDDWAYNDTVTDAQRLSDGNYLVDSSYEAHAVGLSYRYDF